MGERNDDLAAFIRFADTVQATHERAHRPAYAETCPCGGTVEVSRDVSPVERRRIHANFLSRHIRCTAAPAPQPAPAAQAEDEEAVE
jgi:hypothetical protein